MGSHHSLKRLFEALDHADIQAARKAAQEVQFELTQGLQLAGEVLHELRQPLVGIKAYVQLLQNEHPTSLPVAHLLAQVHRMELIISDFARISSETPPPFEPMNLALAVRHAQQMFAANLESARVSVEVDAPLVAEIQGNERLIEQLTLNLLINARDAMAGTGKIKVTIRHETEGVSLMVADWGPGIPPSLAPRIFQPYVSTKSRGSGLGLTVCHRIAEDHRAQISLAAPQVFSEHPSPATVFRVLFPTLAEKAAPVRKRILVIDDESIIQMVFQDLLSREYEIIVAGTAEEGLKHIQNGGVDLIITDKNLPGISGMELAQEARRCDPTSRVILMTGYPSLVTAQQALELGVVDYLLKPFDDIREVREKIRAALIMPMPLAPTRVEGRIDVFEDSPTCARQITEALSLIGLEANVRDSPSYQPASPPPAGVIVSWNFAPAAGPQAIAVARQHGGGVPFVVLAEHVTLETTLACLRAGAAACLPKRLEDKRALCRNLARAFKLGGGDG